MGDKDKEQAEQAEQVEQENKPTAEEISDLNSQWCPEDRVIYDE